MTSSTEMSAPVTPLPQVRLKIARRSSHPWVFQKMVEKPTTRLPNGCVVDMLDRDGQWVGRGFYNGHSRIALRVLTADADEAIDGAFFAAASNAAVALRRQWLGLDAVSRRLSTGAFRGRRAERAGRGPLRQRASAGILLGGHVSLPPGDSGRLDGPLSRQPLLLVRGGARPEAGIVRLPAAGTAAAGGHQRAWSAFPCGSGEQAQDGLLPRPARQPPLPGLVLRRPARARPVLQHRAASRSMRRRWVGPTRWWAWTWTSRRWDWRSRTPT